MKNYSKTFILLFCFALLTGLLANCSNERPKANDDVSMDKDAIQKERDERIKFLKSAQSPLPEQNKTKLPDYYPANDDFYVPTTFVKSSNAERTKMIVGDGIEPKEMYRIGRADFEINGKSFSLSIFAEKSSGESNIYVPFGDLTNSSATSNQGRYVKITDEGELDDGDEFDIDFNSAYSPYSYFNAKYQQMTLPKENKLNVEIKAGEKR